MMSCPRRCTLLPAAAVLLVAVLTLQLAAANMPPSANPYAGKSYGGCKGGFCESADPALELQFWEAASKGDAKLVKQLLSNEKLNLTRNIVPDDDGLSRVLDVAVWVAAEKGRHDVMQALLERPGTLRLYQFEDGHILDIAAMNGDVKMVQLLLDFNMTVGPAAMAHAAHFNHTGVMELLLPKPMDLKSAMQAISNGGSQEMAQLLLKAMKEQQIKEHRPEQGNAAYDWHGDYVSIAVKGGNVPVLKELLAGGYELKWQQAQDLIKAAAEQGSPEVMDILLSQNLFKKDKDELAEAVDTALKASAELGKPDIVDVLIKKFPEEVKAHCKAGVFRAYKYGRDAVVQRLTPLCPVDLAKSSKLQDAEWLGKVANAARDGDAAAMKTLLQHERAKQRIKKLRKPMEEDESGNPKVPEGPAIDPKHDPLVLAAVGGHLDVVTQLEELHMLCSPCAAKEAAKSNQTAVIQHLAGGTAKLVLQNNEDLIQDALRITAYSMEAQNWPLVEWFLKEHASPDLGAYFMPVIAQEGKLQDMKHMLRILSDLGRTDNYYFKQQVHSAMISAALGGYLELMLELQKYSDATLYVQPDADAEGAHVEGDSVDDYEEVVTDDKTEL